MSRPNNPPQDAAQAKAVRRAKDAPIADTAQPAKGANDAKATKQRTPPPNAREIQDSHKTGTVTRAAARAAAKRVSGMV